MIRNYLKIAWRNITKQKVFSLINVIGLTIGLSAAFVIGLMIYYDATFDNFHKDSDRIYRVVTDFESPEGKSYNPGVTLALHDAISDNSNFEAVSGFFRFSPYKIENKSTEQEFKSAPFAILADQAYFKIFDYKFLAGNNQNLLAKPNELVLTENRAKIYFPKLSPAEVIGKSLVYNDSIQTTVTAIVKDFKGRTDIVFNEFLSNSIALHTRHKEQFAEKKWNSTSSSSQLFVKTIPLADLAAVMAQFKRLAKTHEDEDSKKYGQERQFNLQPLSDIHFNEDYGIYDWSQGQASASLLKNLALIALFLLVLGCINFINLNTAQASQRAKEIGIRKTLGSSRKQLVFQFMGETFLLTIISALISIGLTYWLIDIFSEFIPKGLSFELLKTPMVIFGMVILLVTVTFLSGFYPALIISKYNPVEVLKNQITIGKQKFQLRKVLTVFQFAIAQVFIIATLLVGHQIKYLLNKDMGFKTEAIVSIRTPYNNNTISKKMVLAEQLKSISQVQTASVGGSAPASFSLHSMGVTYLDGTKEINSDLQLLYGDTQYFDLFDFELLAGRQNRNDTIKEFVINDTYRKQLGFKTPQDAIGINLIIDEENVPVVGVMKDFYQRSLKSDVKPMALIGDWWQDEWSQFHTVHLALQEQSNLTAAINEVEASFKSIYPDADFRMRFMDEAIQRFYNREQKISKLLNWATGLSVLISCLGLLGLVIYTTNRRVKEIGVRKVLGASFLQLNVLLCKEFIVLVGIAFLVAAPIAWLGVNDWLQDFANRATINLWIFLWSGFAMIFFALLVISAKTIQAANSNPVDSLRSE